ncbi:MAG: kelch repeat-containing protein [Hyalangium sp.]
MKQARVAHSATLLPNGKVLVAGGGDTTGPIASTELYDPATNTWSVSPPLTQARSFHTATLLPNGKVLVVGGVGATSALASTELYDPDTNTWSVSAPLTQARQYHTATLLPNGKVLVVGGADQTNNRLASTELYDPAGNTWSSTAPLAQARQHHTATLLPNGKVLVAGGGGDTDRLASTELYDPARNTWSSAAALAQGRTGAMATLLPNGKLLVVGGAGASTLLTSTELYDPDANTWSVSAPLTQARQYHTATLLPNGKVLVVGGADQTNRLASTELYDPGTNTWRFTAPLAEARQHHTATLLPNGRMLVAGGFSSIPATSTEVAGPYTTISAGPAQSDNQTTASFTFTSESGASFECSLDGAPFSACTSPQAYSGLAEGLHTFQVQARDAAGNLDPAPTQYSWRIDLTAPETDLIAAPLSITNRTMAAFAFNSNEPGGSFECSVDAAPFNPCTSPQVYPSLAEGSHTFQVRGRDSAGNLGQKLASHAWSISRAAPQTNIIAAPLPFTYQTTAVFFFDSSEPGSSFECSLDQAPFSPCTSPQSYSSLSEGEHSFRVQVRTAESSLDWANYTWKILTVDEDPPPPPTIQDPTPGKELFSASPVFSGTAEPYSTVTLIIDGAEAGEAQVNDQGDWRANPSSPLTWGAHHASATATDEAGNTSSLSSEVSFSTSRRGYYGMACSASSSTGLASWLWTLVLLGYLRRRSRSAT